MRDHLMRLRGWTVALLGLLALHPAGAQDSTETARLTPVERAAVDVHNARGTLRVLGAWALDSGRTHDGDVAVLNGPVTVAGTVRGSLVAINADVRLAPGARITRDLIVVGGAVTGQASAGVAGETRLQPELMRYRLDGETLVPEGEPRFDDSWWRWKRRQRERNAARERDPDLVDFAVRTGGTYNRVEGLPVLFGPQFRRVQPWGRLEVDALGLVRTAAPVRWGRPTLGHDLRGELLLGKSWGGSLGGRLYDVMDAVEQWQAPAGEAGMAAFFARRDYRDLYGRHGGEAFVSLRGDRDADLRFGYAHERWTSAAARAPVTWGETGVWRPNPTVDEGRLHLMTVRLRADSRERERSFWSGWYLDADIERGQGRLDRQAARDLRPGAAVGPRALTYTRGTFDIRRYNRLSPDAHLNLRAFLGGWWSGDPLPLQRRLSVGGPYALSGYGFRTPPSGTTDDLTCATGPMAPGAPAQCDRAMLLQAEFRWGFSGRSWRRGTKWWDVDFDGEPAVVFFGDAGKGWLVGEPDGTGRTLRRGQLPGWGDLRTSVGAGLDFGGIGFYLAKAVKDGDEPVRGFVRLQRRF